MRHGFKTPLTNTTTATTMKLSSSRLNNAISINSNNHIKLPNEVVFYSTFSNNKYKQQQHNGYQYKQQQQQEQFNNKSSSFGNKSFIGGSILAIGATSAILSSPVLCESTLKELDPRFATIPVEEYEEIKHLRKKSSFQRFLGITTLSGVLGYSSGFATRKIGMFVIFVMGTIFTLIQVLSYYNYLTIHWDRIFREVNPKFDKENRSKYFRTFINILTNNLHVKAGFLSGFYLGFKK